MLCCIRNRCNLSEHAPKKNAVVRFPLYRKERRDDTKVDLDFLFPLFVLSLVSLELCVCLQFWFLRCVSSTGNCKGRMSTERGRERGDGWGWMQCQIYRLSASFELFNARFWICSSKKSLIFQSFLVFQQHNHSWKPKILSVFGIKLSNLS